MRKRPVPLCAACGRVSELRADVWEAGGLLKADVAFCVGQGAQPGSPIA